MGLADLILCLIAGLAGCTCAFVYAIATPRSENKAKLTPMNVIIMIVVSYFIIQWFMTI